MACCWQYEWMALESCNEQLHLLPKWIRTDFPDPKMTVRPAPGNIEYLVFVAWSPKTLSPLILHWSKWMLLRKPDFKRNHTEILEIKIK